MTIIHLVPHHAHHLQEEPKSIKQLSYLIPPFPMSCSLFLWAYLFWIFYVDGTIKCLVFVFDLLLLSVTEV